jgi:hypothetical protein
MPDLPEPRDVEVAPDYWGARELLACANHALDERANVILLQIEWKRLAPGRVPRVEKGYRVAGALFVRDASAQFKYGTAQFDGGFNERLSKPI